LRASSRAGVAGTDAAGTDAAGAGAAGGGSGSRSGARDSGAELEHAPSNPTSRIREYRFTETSIIEKVAILETRALTKTIDTGTHRVEILRGIDLSIPAGQFLAIMGASGSGKTTLLGLMAGLDAPTSGSVIVDGIDITNLREDELALVRGRKIGFVFQSYQLIPTLTAEENVLLPYELSGGDVSKGIARARGLLEEVGLGDRLDHYPVQLSGGEQQRVALARAFMPKPPLLMADEPTGNLDSVNGEHVLELLLSLNQREGTTLILVTHDMTLASRADRIVTLRDGAVIADELQPQDAEARRP
jgi:putative ABC transport system ATP-binding protein